MIERLVVAPGEGTVIRHGNVTAWTGGLASPNLLTFLAESARNLAASPIGGDQIADHLAGVLHRRDPEPDVPFIVIGPSEEGWVALLHGPARVWDGQEWTMPSPGRGWIRAVLAPNPVLAGGPVGAGDFVSWNGSLFDLEGGVVPGGGFTLTPSVSVAREESPALSATVAMSAAAAPAVVAHPEEPEMPDDGPAPAARTAVPEAAAPGPEAAAPGPEPAAPEPAEPEPEIDSDVTALLEAADAYAERHSDQPAPAQMPEPRAEGPAAAAPPAAPPSDPGPPGVLDLRRNEVLARAVQHPPLPPAGESLVPAAGAPVVAGVNCTRHHLNRPGMTTCARCRQPVVTEAGRQSTGARPALGCLITDQGSVYRLDSGYLVGSDPAKDPSVRGRLARPLPLSGEDLAPAHAEIRLQDWDVVLTDRASEGGTFVYAPDGGGWERLQPYEPRVLAPGTHVAFGQCVVTFVSPWRDDEHS